MLDSWYGAGGTVLVGITLVVLSTFLIWLIKPKTNNQCKTPNKVIVTPVKSDGPKKPVSISKGCTRKKNSPELPLTKPNSPLFVSWVKGASSKRPGLYVSISKDGSRVVMTSSEGLCFYFVDGPSGHLSRAGGARNEGLAGDYCTCVDFDSTSSFVYGVTEWSCKMVKFAVNEKMTTLSKVIESKTGSIHKSSVSFIDASVGNWIVTCAGGDDTDVKVFNTSLELLACVDISQIRIFNIACSGKFVAAACWSSGVKLLEVTQQPAGVFKKFGKALEIPTSCGTTAVAFSRDNLKCLIAAKDGTFTMWNVDVRYNMQESARRLLEVKIDFHINCLAFTANQKIVLAGSDNSVKFIDTRTLLVFDEIVGCHDSAIQRILPHPEDEWFLTTSVNNHPSVWKMPLLP